MYGGTGSDRLYGDTGDDFLYGELDNDIIDGGAGNDRLNGGGGDDILLGGDGVDTFNGGDGYDGVDYTYSTGPWSIDLSLGTAESLSGSAEESLVSIENIYAGSGNDFLYGSGLDNYIQGNAGNDYIVGRQGDDRLYGNDGNDRIYGGAHDNVLNGGAGADTVVSQGGDDQLTGGGGADVFEIWLGGDATVTVADLRANDRIRLTDFDNYDLDSDEFYDRLQTSGSSLIYAGDGGNIIFAGISQIDSGQLIFF